MQDRRERYAELLSQFRSARARHGAVRLTVSAPEQSTSLTVNRSVETTIGAVWIPVIREDCEPDLHLLARPSVHTGEMLLDFGRKFLRDCEEVSVRVTTTHDAEAADEFRRLGECGGMHLPLLFRRKMRWKDEPAEFVDRWLTLLFWSQPPDAMQLLKLGELRDGDRPIELIADAFQLSADVVEVCHLHGDRPKYYPVRGPWPYWAGDPPSGRWCMDWDEIYHSDIMNGDGATEVQQQLFAGSVAAESEPSATLFARADSGSTKRGLKGVSLQDAAFMIRNGDPEGQAELVRKWRNKRSLKVPASIGADPEHDQRKLYEPTALLHFLKKFHGEEVDRDFGLAKYFSAVARLPRPAEVD